MVHFEFGQDRLTQPHPLNMFELAQGAIKVPFEARFRNAYCLTASLDTLVHQDSQDCILTIRYIGVLYAYSTEPYPPRAVKFG